MKPSKAPPPCIPCETCCGRGSVPLPQHLATTLANLRAVSKHKRATVSQVHAKAKDEISQNATSNRLRLLTELSLATRIRRGREWLYQNAE